MIQVENLTKYYSDLCAVDQINLEIRKGEILGLLGPNGAGKTTTLRMLTGFLRPSSGSVNILNQNIEEHPLEIRKFWDTFLNPLPCITICWSTII